jgi:hypothetical protein
VIRPFVTKKQFDKKVPAVFTAKRGQCEASGATQQDAVAAWEKKAVEWYFNPQFPVTYRYGKYILLVSQSGDCFEYQIMDLENLGVQGRCGHSTVVFGGSPDVECFLDAVQVGKLALAQRLCDDGDISAMEFVRMDMARGWPEKLDLWMERMEAARVEREKAEVAR